MKIAGLQKTTLIDYPDRIAATVFLAGCNLDCGYCYNRWMIAEGRNEAECGDTSIVSFRASRVPEALSVEAFLAWLRARVDKLDGVCVSGGEPTLAPDLPDLLRAIKGLGFAAKLDTNGTRPEVVRALLDEGLLDYVALDIKAPLDARYGVVAGRPVDPDVIRRTLALLRAWGGAYELRTTVCPDLDRAALRDIAQELFPEERWYLQPCVVTPEVAERLAGRATMGEGALWVVAEELRAVAPGVRVRGE